MLAGDVAVQGDQGLDGVIVGGGGRGGPREEEKDRQPLLCSFIYIYLKLF